MDNLHTLGHTSADLAAVGQHLRRLLQAGKASVNVFNIIQVGERRLAPDQAARLARELEDVLLRFAGKSGQSEAGGRGGSNSSPTREGVFRFDGGDTWEIGLDGKVCGYRNALGLHQMRQLLQRPGQRVPVIELAEVRRQQVVRNQLCAEDVVDAKALAQYRAQLECLQDQLMIAEATGNSERAGELTVQIEALKCQISCAQSRGGIRRRLGDQGNRLRNRVCYTLRSSLQKIIGQAPELGEHLLASIKLGFECGYFPATPVHWAFSEVLEAGRLTGPRIASSDLAQ
jgi:hypothetical protein